MTPAFEPAFPAVLAEQNFSTEAAYRQCLPAPFPGGRLMAALDLLARVSCQDPETMADFERRYGQPKGRRR